MNPHPQTRKYGVLPDLVIRSVEGEAPALAFVIDAIKRSAKGCYLFRDCPDDIFEHNISNYITAILSKSLVLYVGPKDQQNKIYSFLVVEQPEPLVARIHYLYTKFEHRKRGLAKILINAMPSYTNNYSIEHSLTTKVLGLIKVSHPEIVYNPFPLLELLSTNNQG